MGLLGLLKGGARQPHSVLVLSFRLDPNTQGEYTTAALTGKKTFKINGSEVEAQILPLRPAPLVGR